MHEAYFRCLFGEMLEGESDHCSQVATRSESIGSFPQWPIRDVRGALFSAAEDAQDAAQSGCAADKRKEIDDEAGARVVGERYCVAKIFRGDWGM